MPTDSRSADVQAALVNSASQFARNAVAAYLEDQYEVFLVHAATASEHLLKASLCSRSVALIAESTSNHERHFRSLAALLDIDIPAPPSEPVPQSIRTISAEVALVRASRFVAGLSYQGRQSKGLRELFAERNGVVHLGQAAAREDADRLRWPFVAACELLLADIGHDPARYWGTNYDTAGRWGQEARDRAEQAVHDLLDAARRRYELGRRGFGSDVDLHPSEVRARLHHDPVGEALIDCPACGMPCTVSGYPQEARVGAETAFELLLTQLTCEMCLLLLSDPADLPRAGVPSVVPLPGVDEHMVDDFYEMAGTDLVEEDDIPPPGGRHPGNTG